VTSPVRHGLARLAIFDARAWAYLWSYFRKRRWLVALVAVLGALQSAMVLPGLFVVRFAFDHAVPKGQVGVLIACGAGLVALRLAASGVALVVRAMSLKLTKAAICEIRRDLIAALYAMPRDYFGRNDAARVQTRIVMETERIDNLTSVLLSTMLPAALSTLCLTGALIHLNAWLVLILAGLLPFIWLSTLLGGRYVKREVRAFQQAFEGFSRGVQFVLRQMDLTRVRGFEDAELSRQTQGLRQLETSGVRMAMSFAVSAQIQSNLTGIGGLLLLVGGGVAVIHHAMSLGDLMAFYLAAGALNDAANRLMSVAPELIVGDESLRKLLAMGDETQATGYSGAGTLAFKGAVSLRDVDFTYDGKPVLKGLSLELEPGSRTAIVGPNGAGKSTIVNLILGFYHPDRGELAADGHPYETLDLKALRRQIGVVMQRPTFFTGTIAENLAYGWPDVPREAVVRAARQACADAFIEALPQGYDTVIGEGGALISGGEAQRLAIARALIGGPKLVILDEPTNHLDVDAIGEIMGRVTADPIHASVLIISHDMTVVGFADRVLRLRAGALKPLSSGAVAAATE